MDSSFLAFNGTMYGPISGILFADYFFLRHQKYNLWSIFDDHPSSNDYYTRGINWIAMGSLILGQAVYIFIYNPGTGATHPIFFSVNPSLAACFVPFVVYLVAMKVFGWHRRSTETEADAQERINRPSGSKIQVPNLRAARL